MSDGKPVGAVVGVEVGPYVLTAMNAEGASDGDLVCVSSVGRAVGANVVTEKVGP